MSVIFLVNFPIVVEFLTEIEIIRDIYLCDILMCKNVFYVFHKKNTFSMFTFRSVRFSCVIF